MKPNQHTSEGIKAALKALYDATPVTDEDRAEHARLVDREYARREARRRQSPQLEIPEA